MREDCWSADCFSSADHPEVSLRSFRPPALMRRMVEEGKLGKKTGQGFYRWDESA